jgi:hypothetical protein
MGKLLAQLFKGHLLPRLRGDRNGRAVARHMKTALPLPLNSQPEPANVLRCEAAAYLLKSGNVPHSDYYREHELMMEGLKNFSADTLRKINGLSDAWGLYTITNVRDEVGEKNPDEDYVRDLIRLSEHLHSRMDGTHETVLKLGRYTGLCPLGPNGTYPEERYSQQVALIDATQVISDLISSCMIDRSAIERHKLPGRHNYCASIADRKLVKLILESTPAERERITSIMTERRVVDPDTITGFMRGSGHSALAEGAL